jgi:hypothetical protein
MAAATNTIKPISRQDESRRLIACASVTALDAQPHPTKVRMVSY